MIASWMSTHTHTPKKCTVDIFFLKQDIKYPAYGHLGWPTISGNKMDFPFFNVSSISGDFSVMTGMICFA